MEACSQDEMHLSPHEIRDLARTAYHSARSYLEKRRREKIFLNLRKAAPCQHPSSVPHCLRRSSALAMQSLSSVASCKATVERVDRPPNGLAWVRVSTNLKAPDNYKDKFFVPYLGESDEQQNFCNAMAADADISPTEQYVEDDISDVESTVRVTPVESPGPSSGKQLRTIKKKPQRNGESRATLVRDGKTRPKKSSETMWDRAARRVALEQVVKKLGFKDFGPVSDVVGEVLGAGSFGEIESCYKNVMYRRRTYKESDDEARLRSRQKEELLTQLKGTVRARPGEALRGDSIPFFFCRQCYTYNCLEHGTQTAKPAKVPSDRTKKDSATRQGAEDIESRCPDRDLCQCWCVSQSREDAARWWRQMETNKVQMDDLKSVVLELFTSFGKDPCRISEVGRLFEIDQSSDNRLTCHRVGYLLDTLEETNLQDNRPRQVVRRPRKKYRTKAPRGETESMKGGQRVDYAPCQHDGPCTAKNCRCVENGVNCEKYCSCNHNRTYSSRPDKRLLPCNHAFQGCTCKSALACVSNACVCYSYGRECDPDLCRACHECNDSDRARSCRNVGLLMGERQRTVVGHSKTHGWGAFAATDIAKGEIIGEYVGEVVSHIDADRRGILYDEIDYSFLFNITEDWALDSTRLGNKLRYCNHHFKPNSIAKLMRVGGDVRVGLYAVRDIGKHEELFFDYKYKNGPAWSMPGAKGNGVAPRSKQESVKKRAPAVDDDSMDEEVIPVPKKRAKSERRERRSLRSIRDTEQHATARDVDDPNLATGGAIRLEVKNYNKTRLQRASTSMLDTDQTHLSHTVLLSAQKNAKNATESRSAEERGVERSGDGMQVASKTKQQNPHGSTSLCDGSPQEIKFPEKKARELLHGTSKTSRRHVELNDAPPDSRADTVLAVNSLDVDDCDFRTYRLRRQNGLTHRNNNSFHRLSAEKQRISERPTLQDVFGSDLESPDENVNQSVRNAVRPAASRLTSTLAVNISSNSPEDNSDPQRGAPRLAKIAVTKRAKDQISIPSSIAKVQTQRRDKVDKMARARQSRTDYEMSTDSFEAPGVRKSVSMLEEQKLSNAALKDREMLPRCQTRDHSLTKEAGYAARLDSSRSTSIPSRRASSAGPLINLVSDDDET